MFEDRCRDVEAEEAEKREGGNCEAMPCRALNGSLAHQGEIFEDFFGG